MRRMQRTVVVGAAFGVVVAGMGSGGVGAVAAEPTTWQELQATESPDEAALAARQFVRRALGGTPAPPSAASLDGPIWSSIEDGWQLINPITGARSTAPVKGEALAIGPAGDRIAFSTRRFEMIPPEDPDSVVMWSLVTTTVAHEDGSHPLVVSQDELSDYATVDWSPVGESVVGFRAWLGRDPRLVFASVTRQHGRTSPISEKLWHRVKITPRADLMIQGSQYLRVPLPLTVGAPEQGTIAVHSLSSGMRDSVVGLQPGASIATPAARTYVGFADTALGTEGRRVLVDHADGRGAVAVATTGRCGGDFALSPSRRQLAYVKGLQAHSGSCSGAELRVVTVGSTGKFDAASGATERLVSGGVGSSFGELEWQPTPPAAARARLAGANRVATAIATSRASFADHTADVAVLAGTEAFPDALSGSALAGEFNGPALLTNPTLLEQSVATELARVLKPGGRVYVVGGAGAVSDAVLAQLAAAGYAVERLGGVDRYETAAAVARGMDSRRGAVATEVFVATGADFADALVASPAAVSRRAPVLLTNGASMPQATKAYLDEAKARSAAFHAVGGPASAALGTEYPHSAVAGPDRYATAKEIAHTFFVASPVVGLADGRNWPDAVSGGAAMAKLGMPMLLVNGSTLPEATREHIRLTRSAADAVVAFGGTAAVPDAPLRLAVGVAGRQTLYYGPNMP